MRTLKGISLVGLVTLLVVGFQNCQKTVRFNGTLGATLDKSSSSLTPMEISGDENVLSANNSNNSNEGANNTLSENEHNDNNGNSNDDDHSQGQDHTNNQASSDDNGHSCNHSDDNASSNSDNENNEDESNESDEDYFVCILDGPGQSLKLGLVESSLDGVNSVASTVCVTRSGCLNEVSKKFSVKNAVSHEYCEHNPNVVKLTDAELLELLAGQ